jgi:hypothetical protein
VHPTQRAECLDAIESPAGEQMETRRRAVGREFLEQVTDAAGLDATMRSEGTSRTNAGKGIAPRTSAARRDTSPALNVSPTGDCTMRSVITAPFEALHGAQHSDRHAV